jgi:hypothetical protein
MRTDLLRGVLAIAVVLVAGVAAAQDAETSSSGVPGWSVTPGVTVGLLYDSNVALANAPADTGKTKSDRLMAIQPSAQLDFLSPRTEFSSGYAGSLRRYMELNQLNGFDQRAHASVRRLATKYVTLSLGENYAKTPTTDELELNGVPFSRTGAKRNSASGSVDTRLTKFMDLSIGADHTWVKFDRTSPSLLTGGWVAGGRAALTRRLSQRMSVGGEYGVRYAEINQGTHNVVFHDAGGTAHFGLAERTSLGVSAGLAYLDDRSLGEKRRGPYLRADVTQNAQRATLGAAFERTFVPSFGFGGSSQSEQVRAFVHMPLDRNRMYVQGALSWRKSDPLLGNALPLTTTTLRSTVGYAATRQLRTELFYALTRQDTPVAGGQVNRSRIGAQVVISQPMRIQ